MSIGPSGRYIDLPEPDVDQLRVPREHARRDRLPQVGPTGGAAIWINGFQPVNPFEVNYTVPRKVGTAINGNPFYQGKPILTVNWKALDIDQFQGLSTLFFPILNDPAGPIVVVGWYNPYTAGAYEEQMAYMNWPIYGSWSDLYLRDVSVVFSRFGLRPEELSGAS